MKLIFGPDVWFFGSVMERLFVCAIVCVPSNRKITTIGIERLTEKATTMFSHSVNQV